MRTRLAMSIVAAFSLAGQLVSCVGEPPPPDDTEGTLDASDDRSTANDVVTTDAATTANDGGDASPAQGCAAFPGAAFCADFDNVDAATFAEGWTTSQTDLGGSLELLTTGSVSAPGSLRAFIPAFIPSGGPTAVLKKTIVVSPSTKKVRLELDAKFDKFSNAAGGGLNQIFRLSRNADFNPGIRIVANSAGGPRLVYQNAFSVDGGGPQQGNSTIDVAPGSWKHFVLDVLFDDPGFIKLTVDGVNVVDFPAIALLGNNTTAELNLWVGSTPMTIASDHPSITTDIDNVVLTLPP